MTAKELGVRVLTGLAVAVAIIAGGRVYQMWYDRKAPNFRGKVDVYVYPWTTSADVKEVLMSSGAVKKAASLQRVWADEESLQPGHYQIDSTCSSMYAKRMLHHGWQTPVNLTVTAVRTPAALAGKIGAQMMADSTEVSAFILSADSLGFKPAQLFTKIIPDTYQILWTASVREIFEKLFTERDRWWTADRVAAAKKQGLTPSEASVLASIVNGETRYVPEQPAIAAVYLNRLNCGMKLQADPTVAYCFDYTLNRILKSHLAVDSPYNTYKYIGLPPGPISCPPKSCLEAVLKPDSHNYLYFCADPSFNGTHRFASTYSEHLANAREFQKALTERQKARK